MKNIKLLDVLKNNKSAKIIQTWDRTNAAPDFCPLPPGEYEMGLIEGSVTKSLSGTPGYQLTFKVLEGPHAGRRLWHTMWLTEAALPMTKRDLAKLGLTRLEQLDEPLPRGLRCRVKVALRTDDNGHQHNRIRSFEVIGTDP